MLVIVDSSIPFPQEPPDIPVFRSACRSLEAQDELAANEVKAWLYHIPHRLSPLPVVIPFTRSPLHIFRCTFT